MGEGGRALVVFEVGGRPCALPAAAVREVVHMAELQRPPTLPPAIEGFLNYGGTIVPVVRLAALLGVETRPIGLYTPLLIMRVQSPALLVDAVRMVVTVDGDALLPVADDTTLNGCVAAEVRVGEQTLHLLAPDRILAEHERRKIADLQAAMERRLAEFDGATA